MDEGKPPQPREKMLGEPTVIAILRPPEDAPIDLCELAERARVPLLDEPDPRFAYHLQWSGTRLEVACGAGGRAITVDFEGGPAARRWQQPSSRRDPICRAAGVGKEVSTVLDISAGLGRDAYTLARAGLHVRAVERHPIVAALLTDGLRRLSYTDEPDGASSRLHLRCADAAHVLATLTEADRPDAVYFDPMLPQGKSAQVKKELQFLRALLGTDEDARQMFALARTVARKRTVVKRPLRVAPLAPDPDAQFRSTRGRWDVYLAR